MNAIAQKRNEVDVEGAVLTHKGNPRLVREFKTIRAMIYIFCRDHHGHQLCAECQGLIDYATLRVDRCRFGAEKPTCARVSRSLLPT
jgi:Nitrous oxide-stimulated promoter.